MLQHSKILRAEAADDFSPARAGQRIWQMFCPECGELGVEQGNGGDHTAVTVHPDRDDYDSPIGTRGGYVEVRLFCPAGHGFSLIIANHKGAEYVAVISTCPHDYETGN